MRPDWCVTALVLSVLSVGASNAAAPEGLETTREEFEAKLSYKQGQVDIGSGLATLNLGPTFRYLDPEQSERLLVKGWGNPPGNKTLGMVFPADVSPLTAEGWGVIITYEEDGYVDDKGAEKLNYDELLKEMKEGTVEANKERAKAGYAPIQLVGWAEPPQYDSANHKLYWAKDLKFGEGSTDTLNYNIRVLGRRGVLVLNAVAGMNQLPTIKSSMQQLLPAIDFSPGHRYADFIPGKDKMAAYGIGALIAGTIAAKAGLFKVILVGLLAFKKAILVGLAACAGFFRKLFKKKEPAPDAPLEPGR